MKRNILLFLFIIGIAISLRFYKLGSIPISPDWDETALAYNAYSILKTGRDEYGTFLPLSIRSFDDYKPPLYVYLTVPSVAVFGLNIWAVRLPSAIMGVLAVIGTYFLVVELLYKEARNPKHEIRNKFQAPNSKSQTVSNFEHLNFDIVSNFEFRISSLQAIALLSAFLLALSPWHIQFSRIAFEANVGITLNIFAMYFFLLGIRKRIMLPLSAVLFGLGMYAYHSERIFIPLLIIVLLFIYAKQLFTKENKQYIFFAFVAGIVIVMPLIPVLFNKTAILRLRGTSSFTDQTYLLSRTISKIEEDRRIGDSFGELLDNRRLVWLKTVASGYLSHFSLRWLFLTGDNPRHHAPDMGLLYIWELPFLLFGMYQVLKGQKRSIKLFLFGWFLIAPIPASPTTGLPHAIRSLVFLPVFQIFTATGIIKFVSSIRSYASRWKIRYKKIILMMFFTFYFLLFALNFIYYLDMYFVQTNPEYSEFWQYGYKEAVDYTEKNKDKYKKVIVSTALDQSYMFFLFYTKYDPVKYLANGGTKSGSFEESNNRFDTYEFRKLDWSKEVRDGTIMYVGAPGDMPHGNLANITFQNGKPAIEIADNRGGAP